MIPPSKKNRSIEEIIKDFHKERKDCPLQVHSDYLTNKKTGEHLNYCSASSHQPMQWCPYLSFITVTPGVNSDNIPQQYQLCFYDRKK